MLRVPILRSGRSCRCCSMTEHIEENILRRVQPSSLEDDIHSPSSLKEGEQGNLRRVPVVFNGIFQLEVVTVPIEIDRDCWPRIRADPTERAARAGDSAAGTYGTSGPFPEYLEVRRLLEHVYESTAKPGFFLLENGDDRFRVPPLKLKFFTFILRSYFGLQFTPYTWMREGEEVEEYTMFLRQLTLFAHDDVEDRQAVTGFMYSDFLDGSEILCSVDTTMRRV